MIFHLHYETWQRLGKKDHNGPPEVVHVPDNQAVDYLVGLQRPIIVNTDGPGRVVQIKVFPAVDSLGDEQAYRAELQNILFDTQTNPA